MTPRRWDVELCDQLRVAALAAALDLPPIIAHLLVVRGIHDPDEASRFLAPSLDHLHDPFLLADMGRAVDRIAAAIAGRERIAIHGDYDVDGVSSTVMLRRAIERLGGQVTHFIPERLRDGYGLNPPAVDRLHAEGAQVIVSVDCGIRSDAAAGRARELGIDLLVTDHHEPDAALPAAYAVINPKRPDCRYPDKHLAGAGVAFKLVQALCRRFGREQLLPHFVKVAALGTIADVVPLVGENRVLAKLGLEGLSGTRHAVGLRALLDEAKLLGRPLDSYHVAFVLAPRLNAAGRMASPDLAARLLLIAEKDREQEARALARQLSEENTRRQEEERGILDAARGAIDKDPSIGAHNVLVVAGEGWHRGVIGIVASKLVDGFGRPAVVLSVDGDMAHGSCRSIPAFDMLDALTRCEELFERYGGHRQAAGLTIRAERIGEFRRRMAAWGLEALSPEDLFPRVRVDGDLPLSAIGPEVVEGLARLAPFGMGNPSPVFRSGAARVTAGPKVIKQRHLSFSLSQGSRTYRALMWRGAERAAEIEAQRGALDVAYSLENNHYMGETTIELRVADLRQALDDGAAVAPGPAAAAS